MFGSHSQHRWRCIWLFVQSFFTVCSPILKKGVQLVAHTGEWRAKQDRLPERVNPTRNPSSTRVIDIYKQKKRM